MVAHTILFFTVVSITFIVIGLTIINYFNNNDTQVETFLTIVLALLSVIILAVPNKTTTFSEDDYDIYNIIEESDCVIAFEPLLKDESVDYLEFNEYIFNRKIMVLHTTKDNIIKYKNKNNNNNIFDKYKK